MKLIEEMRAALPPYVDIKRVRDWADRLERATVLVAVPDGEAKHPEIGKYHHLYENGGILAIHYRKNEMFYLSENPGFVKLSKHSDGFTPVRLVPLAEAEL